MAVLCVIPSVSSTQATFFHLNPAPGPRPQLQGDGVRSRRLVVVQHVDAGVGHGAQQELVEPPPDGSAHCLRLVTEGDDPTKVEVHRTHLCDDYDLKMAISVK